MRLTCVALCLLCGCGGGPAPLSDGGTPSMDGGDECTGAPDGSACGTDGICVSGSCTASRCGDGILDPRRGEQCDDANDAAFDGCEPAGSPTECQFTCDDPGACTDGMECNGVESCNLLTHVCENGPPPADGSACTHDGIDGVCRAGACVMPGCGNGVVEAGEECDDANDDSADGCTIECLFTCTAERPCTDGDACNGVETCRLLDHTCQLGTPVVCDDASACTTDSCDPSTGECVFTLIDADGDGFASIDLGSCGTDCNDVRDDVCPDSVQCPEQCDSIDHDCNGSPVPATAPIWYVDCDADGYAALGAANSGRSCDAPAPSACGGGWTVRVPVSTDRRSLDCNDTNAEVNPGAGAHTTAIPGVPASIDFDYDCDGVETRSQTTLAVTCTLNASRTACTGTPGWLGGAIPACGVAADYMVTCGFSLGRCLTAVRRGAQQACE